MIGKEKNPKPVVRCSECDSETDHYYIFVSPINEESAVCWQCQMREEKGFNAKKTFRRQSRRGTIPR